ncbi:MAG: hypothetical protein IJA32_03090 [Lachnospiraceae bacterium]|nr:hypothetical protein [Lachnospiraceae bacterium]
MDRVKKFDRMLEKIEDYKFVMSKFVMYLCLVLGCSWMLIPLNRGEPFFWLISYYIIFFGIACYLKSYGCAEKGTSIYMVLRWMPVDKKEIYKVRREYLDRLVLKVAIVIFVLQQAGALLNHSWNVWNIVYPLATAGLIWLSGVLYIKMVMRIFK